MNDVFFEERYALMRGRIQEIQKEEVVKEPYGEYFRKTADFILMVDNLYEKIQKGWLDSASQKELEENNHALYKDILPENYGASYGNPAYAQKMLGEEFGVLLSFLYAEIRGMVVFV